jgi:hypothetical protein
MKSPDILAFRRYSRDAPDDSSTIYDKNNAHMGIRIDIQEAVQADFELRFFIGFPDSGFRNAFAKIDIASWKSPGAGCRIDISAKQPDPLALTRHCGGNHFWIKVENISTSGADFPEMLFDLNIAFFQSGAATRTISGPIGCSRVLKFMMGSSVMHGVALLYLEYLILGFPPGSQRSIITACLNDP